MLIVKVKEATLNKDYYISLEFYSYHVLIPGKENPI